MANPRSGLSAQVGIELESTYGTYVAPTVFTPLIPANTNLGQKIDRTESDGVITARRLLTADQWTPSDRTNDGDIGLYLYNKGLRKWFKAMFGGESGSGPYTYTPDDLMDDSATIQLCFPDTSGGFDPFTYLGCQVTGWTLAFQKAEYVTLAVSVAAKHEVLYRTVADAVNNTSTLLTSATAAFVPDDVGKPISGTNIAAGTTIAAVVSATNITLSQASTGSGSSQSIVIGVALASASFSSSQQPFHHKGTTVTLAGSAFKVNDGTLSGDNGLDVGRRPAGQDTIDQPLEADLRAYTGTLNAEFLSYAAYRRFVNGTEAALVMTFADTTGASAVITMNVRFDGDPRAYDGRGIVKQALPFKCIGTTTDAAGITAVLSAA